MRKKYKVGDKVRATYKNQTTEHYYGIGTVMVLERRDIYLVKFDNGDSFFFHEFELETDREVVQFT